mmetsp:Transcript_38005/g.88819  ORF Transcript_38005/g.88819 Transcript_38005/m.88819 type:complete len:643 (+) Transcript_38005:206-2134(+)
MLRLLPCGGFQRRVFRISLVLLAVLGITWRGGIGSQSPVEIAAVVHAAQETPPEDSEHRGQSPSEESQSESQDPEAADVPPQLSPAGPAAQSVSSLEAEMDVEESDTSAASADELDPVASATGKKLDTSLSTSTARSLEAVEMVPFSQLPPGAQQLLYEIGPPSKVQSPRQMSPAISDASWHGSDRRCAIVTLLIGRTDVTKYAAFLEVATRIREVFAFESEYPHIVFHEGDLPIEHQRFMRNKLSFLQFYSLASVWKTPSWMPPRSEWQAKDRTEGYRLMCRFYSLQLFSIMAKLGYDAFMRVDDDLFIMLQVHYDPFRHMYEKGLLYLYPVKIQECHLPTTWTMIKWVKGYCLGFDWGSRRPNPEKACDDLAEDTMSQMIFDHMFVTRVSFWLEPDVVRFLYDMDQTAQMWNNRWGDAPVQTAALQLFAPEGSVQRLDGLMYEHTSGRNLVYAWGYTWCLECEEASRIFVMVQKFLSVSGFLLGHKDRVAAAQIETWRQDILNTDIGPRASFIAEEIRNIPQQKMFDIVHEIGIWCDGAARIAHFWSMPRYCCCHLDNYRTTEQEITEVNHKVVKAVIKHAGLQVLRRDSDLTLTDLNLTVHTSRAPRASARGRRSPVNIMDALMQGKPVLRQRRLRLLE